MPEPKIRKSTTKKGLTTKKDLTKNYVPVTAGYAFSPGRTLSLQPDSAELLDGDTYDRMETDPTISKALKIIITNVLADDLQTAPGATKEEVGEKKYKLYEYVNDFSNRLINGSDVPLRETLDQLLRNAVPHGHGIGETIWEYRMDVPQTKERAPQKPKTKVSAIKAFFGFKAEADTTETDQGQEIEGLYPTLGPSIKLMLKSIKVKPRDTTRFVVDEYFNILGLVPSRQGYGEKIGWNEVIGREKFIVLTLNKKNADPRGGSSYRAAYNWYKLKTTLPAEMYRYILQELVPQAIGTLPEDAEGFVMQRDEEGQILYEDSENLVPKMETPAETMSKIIANFRGGSGAVIPYGASLEPYKKGLTGSNDARLFTTLIKAIDDQMENSMLLQVLAQSEGQHQAKAASQQVAELLHNLTFWIRWLISTMIMQDIIKVGVRINLGEWALEYLPQLSLGDFVRRDWATDLGAVADAYFKGFIDDSQRAELMAWLNLPTPGPSRQELNQDTLAVQDLNGNPGNKNRPDKEQGNKDRNKGNGTEKEDEEKSRVVYGVSNLNRLGYHGRRPRRS